MPSPDDVVPNPQTASHVVEIPPRAAVPNSAMEDAQTPVKCMGQLFNSQQYWTPKTRTQQWGPMQSSPAACIRASNSGPLTRTAPHLNTPSSLGMKMTPKGQLASNGTPCSSKKKSTPLSSKQTIPHNPFDNHILENLHGSFFSPNVFAQCSSAEQTPKSFKWTVDELAMIKPADIEEMQLQADNISMQPDQELERRAQDAIDAYFAQNLIVPSPWSDNSKKPHQLPMTPRTPGISSSPAVSSDSPAPVANKSKSSPSKNHAVCQTALSLPPEFDLEKILSDFYTEDMEPETEQEDASPPDSLSMSSLRRKLFFHGEEGSVPSPVRPSKSSTRTGMDFNHVSPTVSPVKFQTPKQQTDRSSMLQTPGSAQFSSSPIGGPHCMKSVTPRLRRCSTDPDMMDSPGFSPIGSMNLAPQAGSQTPLGRPLQATPSTGRSLSSGPFGSPGMSPIVQMEGSFANSPQSHSWLKRRSQRPKKVPVPEELLLKSPSLKPEHQEQVDIGVQRMDVESEDFYEEDDLDCLSFIAGNNNPLSGARRRTDDDTQYSEGESSDQDTRQQTYFVSQMSQDTGYNTNSLQLTTAQDPGQVTGLGSQQELSSNSHTNLTQQFGGMPFLSQDTGLDLEDSSLEPSSQEPCSTTSDLDTKSSTRKVITRHLSTKTSTKIPGFGTEPLHDCEVIRRARRVLGQSISLDESQQKGLSDLKPRILNGVSAFPLVPPRQGSSGDLTKGTRVLPSDLAREVIHKAGQDYNKYCGSVRSSTERLHEMDMYEDSPAQDDYYLVPAEQADQPNFRVSMSAEF